MNVPGITVSTRDILNALVEVGGEEKLALIDYKRNSTVLGSTSFPASRPSRAVTDPTFHKSRHTGLEDSKPTRPSLWASRRTIKKRDF